MDIQYKVDIIPSYEWSEKTHELNISHRELEVLALIVEGYKNKETAQTLKPPPTPLPRPSQKGSPNNLISKNLT